jgi:hypothetical protein
MWMVLDRANCKVGLHSRVLKQNRGHKHYVVVEKYHAFTNRRSQSSTPAFMSTWIPFATNHGYGKSRTASYKPFI